MSRYRGPKLRITRRLGTLPGLTTKSNKINRAGKDGNANADTGKKIDRNGGVRLEEKQKIEI
jgi:small subunit ribosomal protein S4